MQTRSGAILALVLLFIVGTQAARVAIELPPEAPTSLESLHDLGRTLGLRYVGHLPLLPHTFLFEPLPSHRLAAVHTPTSLTALSPHPHSAPQKRHLSAFTDVNVQTATHSPDTDTHRAKRALLDMAEKLPGGARVQLVRSRPREKRSLVREDGSNVDTHSRVHVDEAAREKRQSFDVADPLYPKQWHLHGPFGLAAPAAWRQGILGTGVRIAIVDDGLQVDHPDLRENLRLDSSFNFNANVTSPNPRFLVGPSGDWHGTASGGAAAARDDGKTCGVGVAPRAELAGLAILQNNVDVGDDIEALALGYHIDKNHIFSNSWGPIRPGAAGHRNEAPGPLTAATMARAVADGRGGLGSIYVWAAGNDGSSRDNCNYDGYANMRTVVLVGATDHAGVAGSYSEPCAALLGMAPGGSIAGSKITTTDLLGSNGLDRSGDCTAYAGTSAACPQAAGLIALVLEANPTLSWLDLQLVLADATTRHNNDTRWRQNGAGRWVSEAYGFGLFNAARAVKLAREWGEAQRHVEEFTLTFNGTVTADTSYFDVGVVSVPEALRVHHVEVEVWTSHASVADTTIVLHSPSRSHSVLATPHSDSLSQWQGWRFLSRLYATLNAHVADVRHHGEEGQGEWTLNVSTSRAHSAQLQRFVLTLHGEALPAAAAPRGAAPRHVAPADPPAVHRTATLLAGGAFAVILFVQLRRYYNAKAAPTPAAIV